MCFSFLRKMRLDGLEAAQLFESVLGAVGTVGGGESFGKSMPLGGVELTGLVISERISPMQVIRLCRYIDRRSIDKNRTFVL